MIRIDDKIISLDVIEKKFICDVCKCKGICCYDGESGAPLEQDEAYAIDKDYSVIKKYITPKGRKAVKKHGVSLIDTDGELVTPLIEDKECAYAIVENGIYKCGIELACLNEEISIKKPISCHLYPIRIKSYEKYDAVNYQKWSVCSPAVELGEKNNMPVYKFLKEAIIIKYGDEFYEKLEIAANQIQNKIPNTHGKH